MAKQIISVSRRTDIPAFYADWFMERVRSGYCTVPNPFNRNQVSRVSLKPSDVMSFVFWTRNPKPLMKYLPELDRMGFSYYIQYTIIGYPREIDHYSPPVEESIQTLRELSSIIGRERVIWRYDPILLSDITPYVWHEKQLSHLIDSLKDYTKRLVISFVDPYSRKGARLNRINGTDIRFAPDAFEPEAYRGLAEFIGRKASEAGMEVQTCAEAADLLRYGIRKGKCIDDELISAITGGESALLKKDPSQRKLCGCAVSKDIGINNTCLFGCEYCYATSNIGAAEINYKKHDPASPSLIPQTSS